MREDNIFKKVPPVIPPTAEQIARARMTVCANSPDARAAEALLRMLDLL